MHQNIPIFLYPKCPSSDYERSFFIASSLFQNIMDKITPEWLFEKSLKSIYKSSMIKISLFQNLKNIWQQVQWVTFIYNKGGKFLAKLVLERNGSENLWNGKKCRISKQHMRDRVYDKKMWKCGNKVHFKTEIPGHHLWRWYLSILL